ncbi:MAG TPA: 1,4-dihydroxy-2-naphthoate octaprenyltransferase [Candidatus Binataceae bacterium]|nr:1,4-dihydroxy-2-naphthoate octaprenyltransferase [Candidatus Binataceae bacterium]
MTEAETTSLQRPLRPGTLSVWLQASRAWTLGMPFVSVSVGTFAGLRAYDVFSPIKYLVAAAAAMALQAGANMVNDYYDFANGTDSPDWNSPENFGPGLVIQRGFLRPEQVWIGGIVALVFGSILGLSLAYVCGWPVLILGLLGVAGAYFYTGAPLSLAYHGLGDLMVFTLMGPGYVLGAHYVQALHFSWTAAIASIPMGCLCSGVLQANNLRDIDNDSAHGKWTMAALLGRNRAVTELMVTNTVAYLAVIVGAITGFLPWPALAALVTAPRALEEVRLVGQGPDAERHNRAMALSGQLQFEFGLLLTAGLIVGWFLGK